MENINYFDIVVGVVVLLLGLKGILNGFFKEFFGLLGIIGGIFIASRMSSEVGQIASDLIFKFDNQSAIDFTGFLITLAAFWLIMIFFGIIFKKFANASGLGPIDKLFGFIFGSAKFFLIAAVIVYAMNNIKAIAKNIEPMMQNSILFPVMVEVGGIIMKIDPSEVNESIKEQTKEVSDAIKEQTQEVKEKIEQSSDKLIDDGAKELIDDVKKNIEISKESLTKE